MKVDLAMLIISMLILLVVGITSYVDYTVKRDCLAAGYASHTVVFPFEGYCIKRVDQTDVVIPVEGIRK